MGKTHITMKKAYSEPLIESRLEKIDLNRFNIHIPLIVSNDLPKTFIRVLANTQQIKIANQLLKTIEKAGDSIFTGTEEAIIKKLKESIEIAQEEILTEGIDIKVIRDPEKITKIAKAATAVIGTAVIAKQFLSKPKEVQKGKETKDGTEFGIKTKDSIGGEGLLFTSDYSEIEIQSSSILKRFFGTGKVTLAIKVYIVALDIEEFSAGVFNLQKAVKQATNKVSSGSPITKGSFGQVINDQMIKERKWGHLLEGKKIGCSVALSSLAIEELKYKGIDFDKTDDIKKLIDVLNIFDLFIVREETEEVEYLDPDTFKFNSIPYGILKTGNSQRRKISLAID